MKQVRYCGDGGSYVPNVPADPDVVLELDDLELAAQLIATGLYEVVPARGGAKTPKQPAMPGAPPAEGNE